MIRYCVVGNSKPESHSKLAVENDKKDLIDRLAHSFFVCQGSVIQFVVLDIITVA